MLVHGDQDASDARWLETELQMRRPALTTFPLNHDLAHSRLFQNSRPIMLGHEAVANCVLGVLALHRENHFEIETDRLQWGVLEDRKYAICQIAQYRPLL